MTTHHSRTENQLVNYHTYIEHSIFKATIYYKGFIQREKIFNQTVNLPYDTQTDKIQVYNYKFTIQLAYNLVYV